jgi:hypothetical protein
MYRWRSRAVIIDQLIGRRSLSSGCRDADVVVVGGGHAGMQ